MASRGKEYKPTDADRRFVERAVMAGSSLLEIAAALNVHDDTLRKHYRYEISTARERLKVLAIGVLNDCLDDGNLDAAKFVLARVAGWAERTESKVAVGGITDGLDADERAELRAALERERAERAAGRSGEDGEPPPA